MKRKMGRGRFAAAVLILTFISVYFCAGTVMSRSGLSAQELEGYYREKEKSLVQDVKDFLDGEGFLHSGVMLTRVVDADGSRVYTLTVHHGKIDKMCQENRMLLMEKLEGIVFEDADSSFRHEFLINQ